MSNIIDAVLPEESLKKTPKRFVVMLVKTE